MRFIMQAPCGAGNLDHDGICQFLIVGVVLNDETWSAALAALSGGKGKPSQDNVPAPDHCLNSFGPYRCGVRSNGTTVGLLSPCRGIQSSKITSGVYGSSSMSSEECFSRRRMTS